MLIGEIYMKSILFLFFVFVLGYYSANSQNLIIKRTDVLDSNATFVTATYNFGFEILLDGVPNSNSISFKLNYNLSEYVKFSQWKKGDFDVLQAVNFDNGDGTASLIIGVSSGLYPQPLSNPTPKVIELEFVVVKSAPNLANLFMSFERPVATAIDSSIGSNIPITSEPLNFTVHSYVNVWPGDTDNNGVVDHLDFVPVSQYIGMGSGTKGFRSFKRQASSALWTPQRVLTWDSAAVTFVDCDGNGDITTSDMLIVTYNLGKDTLHPHGKPDVNGIPQKEAITNIMLSEDNIVYPINISANSKFSGVAGYFEILDDSEFIGIEKGNLLPSDNYLYFFQKENRVYFVSSNANLVENSLDYGNIFNLVFKNNDQGELPNIIIKEIKAINQNGSIFDLNSLTSVDDSDIEFEFNYTNNQILIQSDSEIQSLEIVNIFGQQISSNDYFSKSISQEIGNLESGVYFVKIIFSDSYIIRKISITK